MRKFRLVVTGNPGAGKHTCAKIIGEKLSAELVDINKVAIDNGAIADRTDRGLDVDVRKLSRMLAKLLRSKKDLIIVGHLATYVLQPAGINLVAVLRRSPYELEKSLMKRGYDEAKIKENVESEILGVSFYDSVKRFGRRKVAEFDTTGESPLHTAEKIISTMQRKSPRTAAPVDWLSLVAEKGDIKRFFEY